MVNYQDFKGNNKDITKYPGSKCKYMYVIAIPIVGLELVQGIFIIFSDFENPNNIYKNYERP